jgi:ribonuclease III
MRKQAEYNDQKNNLVKLQEKIGYFFNDISLLIQALTHRSYAHEHNQKNNERFEFLGDAVLQFLISDYLMTHYPDLSEGMLSKFRSVLVSESGLSRLSKKIGLGEYLFIGKGEEVTGGRKKNSILADAVEALFSAIYLDSRQKHQVLMVTRIVNALFEDEIEKAELVYTSIDYKTDLQELVQKNKLGNLQYKIIKESGPDHDKEFVTEITINDIDYGVGVGKSKKSSEQTAAIAALSKLKKLNGT